MNKIKNLNLAIIIALITLNSCDSKYEKSHTDSINAGELTVYCDKSIFEVLDTTFKMYQNSYPNIKFTLVKADSRECMNMILSGQANAVIVARNYLPDEDSLMIEFDVERTEMIAAEDALVFYVDRNFPLDTLNHEQIIEILSTNKRFRDFYPQLTFEPELVSNTRRSSEYANFLQLVLGDRQLSKPVKFLTGYDSVKNYVKDNPNAIGIGYLSQIIRQIDWKPLRISFLSENGKREPPQVVHQAFIVQRRYPYIVKYRVLISEGTMSRAFWFASFLSKESIVQNYFNEFGIVPGFAKIKLIKQD